MPDFTAEQHAEPPIRIVSAWHIGVMSIGVSFVLLGLCLPA